MTDEAKILLDEIVDIENEPTPFGKQYGGDVFTITEEALTPRCPNGGTHWVYSVSQHEYIVLRGEPGEVKHLSILRKRN